jgi:hypothetical protein
VGNRSLNPLEWGADQKVYNQEIGNVKEQIKAKRKLLNGASKEEANIIMADVAAMEARLKDLEFRKKKFLKRERDIS